MTTMSSNPEDEEKPQKQKRPRLRVVEDAEERPSVGESLRDAEAPGAACEVPMGFALDKIGVWQQKIRLNVDTGERVPERTRAAYAPMVVKSRLKDLDDGSEHTELAWKWPHENAWTTQIVERRTCLESSSIMALAASGGPVDSATAKGATRYLASFEALNRARIPERRTTSHMGWQGHPDEDGFPSTEHGFMWGRELIAPNGRGGSAVEFRGMGPGDERSAGGYRAAGELREWVDLFTRCAPYPLVQAGVYVALLPPLLDILGCPNFCFEWAGTTSRGKTTAFTLAASVWGHPDQRHTDGSVARGWDATVVGIEQAAQFCSGTPLFVDDTKVASNKERIPQLIYTIEKGLGRTRGARNGGMQLNRTFRTVLISTGEAPLISFSRDGGLRTRVLEVMDPPFGEYSEQTRDLVAAVREGSLANHGLLGPLFVAWLLEHRKRWGEWRAAFQAYRQHEQKTAKSEQATRMLEYVAAVRMAAELLEECLEQTVPAWGSLEEWPLIQHQCFPAVACLAHLRAAARHQAADAAPSVRALDWLRSWMAGHAQDFWGQRPGPRMHPAHDPEPSDVAPGSGWLGRWKEADEVVYVLPDRLESALEAAGFDAAAVVHAWVEDGTIRCEKGHHTVLVRLAGVRSRAYAFPAATLWPPEQDEAKPTA